MEIKMNIKNLILIATFFTSVAVQADTATYPKDKIGDVVELAQFISTEDIQLKKNSMILVDNALDIFIKKRLVYSLFIPGANSWNRNFLEDAKSDLNKKIKEIQEAEEACVGGGSIVGTLIDWDSNLFGSGKVIVVDPASLNIKCNEIL